MLKNITSEIRVFVAALTATIFILTELTVIHYNFILIIY